MNRFQLLKNTIKGELLKLSYKFIQPKINFGLRHSSNRKNKIIVSLTSYGRRVEKTVHLTLISLLKQDYKPDRIILWLDKDHWSNDNIPRVIKTLKGKGIEIRYCDDIKSYKKLIPTLKLCPNDYIITVDDDQYYPKNFIEGLVNAIDENPNNIYAYTVHKLTFDEEQNLKPYMEWTLCSSNHKQGLFFPTGVGGIIYNPNNLHNDVINEHLFMTLAPKADDIWFFFMAFLIGKRCIPIQPKTDPIPLDNIYQKFHTGSSLRDCNWGEALNDKQIRAVMEYYNISDEQLYDFSLENKHE